jgi:hypothetical protein
MPAQFHPIDENQKDWEIQIIANEIGGKYISPTPKPNYHDNSIIKIIRQ